MQRYLFFNTNPAPTASRERYYLYYIGEVGETSARAVLERCLRQATDPVEYQHIAQYCYSRTMGYPIPSHLEVPALLMGQDAACLGCWSCEAVSSLDTILFEDYEKLCLYHV